MPSTLRASTSSLLAKGSSLSWRFTKVMNMSDLSRDDDFLSHLLVEKLGTGSVPLLVHKMDPSRRLPKTDANDLLQIVRRLVVAKGQPTTAVREAVDDLLLLSPIQYYLRVYSQKQINAFATHASRYVELYLPSGSIEIAHTSRYAHQTGKSELCILAARALTTGSVITELKGSMADLTDEEDRELKRATSTGLSGIRRDFSVIHSKQLKKNHLFLGPARFVNHDCDHNVELFREGRYITFRVIKPIGVGEEVTAHYGDDYFGRNNRHCLCQSCEKAGRGGYTAEDGLQQSSSSDSDSDASDSSSSDTEKDAEPLNINERRTRRGVYAVMPEDPREREASTAPKIELDVEDDGSLLSISRSPSSAVPLGLVTPDSTLPSRAPSISSSLTSLSAEINQISRKVPKRMIPLKPSTRTPVLATPEPPQPSQPGVPARGSLQQLPTPPLSVDTATPTTSVRSSARLQARVSARPDQGDELSRTATPSNEAIDLIKPSKSLPSDVEVQESRVLRPRPSLNPSEVASGGKSSGKGEGPSKPARGPKKAADKRLPTCPTCDGVLPVISVDSEIVWGLEGFNEKGKGKGKRKLQEKRECPRCMRHHAIYNVPWPNRTPTNGGTAFEPIPRRESSRPTDMSTSSRDVSKSATPNDRSASLSTSQSLKARSKVRRDEIEQHERPSKRRKLDAVVRGRTQMSIKSRSLLGVGQSRSGRARVPSRKLRDSVPPLLTTPEKLRGVVKEESPDSPGKDELLAQPQREHFKLPPPDRKAVKLPTREERAAARARIRAKLDKEAKRKEKRATEAPVAGNASGNVDIQVSKKRPRDSETDGSDERFHRRSHPAESDEESAPLSRTSPGRSSMIGMPRLRYNGASNLLSHTPNPLLFARRKWVPATLPEPESEPDLHYNYPPVSRSSQTSTDDDSDAPVTPEDNDGLASSPIITPGSEQDGDTSFKFVPRATSFVGRAMKPSPVNFAMKRWSAVSDVPKPGLATVPVDSSFEACASLPMESLDTNEFFEADSPEDTMEPSSIHSTPGKSLTYVPSRIWEVDSSKNQHRTISEFPESSRFVLRRKASFSSSPAVGFATDDSENTVEQLISEDPPSGSDISGTDDTHEQMETVMTVTMLGNAIQLLVGNSGTDSVENTHLQCTAVSLPQSTQKESCSSQITQTAAFATPFLQTSLIKAGWDRDTEP